MTGTGLSIAVQGLTLRHAMGEPVLQHATLAVTSGSICAVLGKSGTGKSTLLAALGGRLAPTAGRILLGGMLLDRASRRRLQPLIGMSYQDHRLVLQATVLDNVVAGLAPHLPWWRLATGRIPEELLARAAELLERLGLDAQLHHRRADNLSGGQAQRVGVARALIARPQLLLADEPVANLDPQTARDVLSLIVEETSKNGATVVCALHQPDLAAAFADRVLRLDGGAVMDELPKPRRSAA